MPQSLLALGAMGIVMFLSLQQARHTTQTQVEKVDIDVTTVATQIAVDRLNELRLLAFDEGTKGDRIWTPSELTSLLPLSSDPAHVFEYFPQRRAAHGGGPDVPDDDLDDFDGITYTALKSMGQDTMRFSVDSVVGYVQDDSVGASSSTQTNLKKVVVRVTALGVQSAPSVTLSQFYSCSSLCAW